MGTQTLTSRMKFVASAATAAIVATLGIAAFTAAPAVAAGNTVGGITPLMQIDGNRAADGGYDWENIAAGNYGPYTTPEGYPSTGIIGTAEGGEYCVGGPGTGPDTTIFKPGTSLNTNPWPTGTGAPNKKADLCEAGAAYEIVDVNGQQHVILYQFWTRAEDGTGDLTVCQELKGDGVGRTGDYLLEFNYDANGGGGIMVRSLRWTGNQWTATAATYISAYGTNGVNGNVGTFGESAVDLTATGLISEDSCTTVQSGWILSKTGEGANSNLEDYLDPAESLSFSTCTDLRVTKTVVGNAPAGMTFPYTISQEDSREVHPAAGAPGWSSFGYAMTDQDSSVSSITSSIGDGETHTWSNVITQLDYQVLENIADMAADPAYAGVTLDSIACTYTDLFQAGAPEVTTMLYENGEPTGNTFPIFGLDLTPTAAHCEITNVVTSLTLDKNLVNDHNGPATLADFTLTATTATGTPVVSGTDPDPAIGTGLTALVNPGTYTLSETVPAALQSAYTSGAFTCVLRNQDGTTTPRAVTNGQVVVAHNEAVECQVTNNDNPASLTLVKNVQNSFGGTAVDTDFTLTATSATTAIEGAENSPEVTNAAVPAGTYTIGEQVHAGYEMTGVACWSDSTRQSELTVTNNQVSVANGASAFCEVTNHDLPAKLTLQKVVENDHNGPATVADWTLTATGPTPISGVTGDAAITGAEVTIGSYTLTEAGPYSSIYDMQSWVCSNATLVGNVVTVEAGADAVCTVTNNDKPGSLTLLKQVVNTFNGQAIDTDFTLTATQNDVVISGSEGDAAVTNANVAAGTYTIGEEDFAGYEMAGVACYSDSVLTTSVTMTGNDVTIANGQSLWCEVTNNDLPATLTLSKVVTNDHGGTSTVADWTLTATHIDPAVGTTITGVTGDTAITGAEVAIGSYTLTESGAHQSLYDMTGWVCTGGTLDGNVVTLEAGADAECVVTNNDKPATLTLTKTVTNSFNGPAVDTDFTLIATGPNSLEGTEGDPAVTAVEVSAGTYAINELQVDGYRQTAIACFAGAADGTPLTMVANTVTIANGQNVFCDIANEDIPAQLTLEKVVVNDNGATTVITDWTLTATHNDTAVGTMISGVTGDAAITAAQVAIGSYTLSESGAQSGLYDQSAWVCTGATLDGDVVTLTAGADAVCVITNDDKPATLTLRKTVTNNFNGTAVDTDFTLTASTAGAVVMSGAEGDDAVTNVTVSAGTYTINELQLDGYRQTGITCFSGEMFDPIGIAMSGNTVTIANGQHVTCDIANEDIPAVLTLEKVVENNFGGIATAADFTLTATHTEGLKTIMGVTADDSVTAVEVPIGTYTLSEWGTYLGDYTASEWACDNATVTDATVTLTAGANVTCTIVNTDKPATLTLEKVVINDHGATSTVADFTLTATGPDTISGTTGAAAVTGAEVTVGDYVLTESGDAMARYDASAWSCTGATLDGNVVTLRPGANATCVITNNDKPATLTIVKNVINDNNGDAVDTDFTLTATSGTTVITGVEGDAAITEAQVLAGTYTIGEEVVSGYTQTGLACWTNAERTTSLAMTGADVTVGNGESAFCEITNDDDAPTLTLIKQVVNEHGGTAEVADFTLTAEGPATYTGVTGDDQITAHEILAGDYTLSETMIEHYAAGEWSCAFNGGEPVLGADIEVSLGDDVVCTIVNTAQLATTLTLIKQVTDDADIEPTEFVLTADGPTPITGVTGDDAITAAQVMPGTYELAEQDVQGFHSAAGWACEGATVRLDDAGVAMVTLAYGDDVVCTIVNQPNTIDLALTKDDGGITATHGDIFDYTITVTNVGMQMREGAPVTVVDTLPAGMVFVSSDAACTADASTVTCEIDSAELAPGASVTITLTVMFEESAPAGDYTNIAWVTTPGDPGPEEPTCPEPGAEAVSNNVDCEQTPLVEGHVSATKSVWEKNVGGTWGPSDGIAAYGDPLQYRIAVTAAGQAPSTNVTVIDTLVAGLGANGDATCSVTCTATYDAATRTHTVVFASMAPGETATVTINVTLPQRPDVTPGATVSNTWTNIAAVAADRQPETPTNKVMTKATYTAPPALVVTGAPSSAGIVWLATAMILLGFAAMRRRRTETA